MSVSDIAIYPGRWRVRFAWWPVRLWTTHRVDRALFVKPIKGRSGLRWLRKVVEVETLWNEWIAYLDYQT